VNKTNQFCTFFVDGIHFGIEVLEVQEVLRFQSMTPVLRGQIVTAFDLRTRLDMPDRSPGQNPMNVVIRSDDGAVSLLVDEIGDVLETREDQFEPPPATLDATTRALLTGVFKLENHLLLILDTEKTLAIETSSLN
jgi:purine-binding chemotaxis protein CheW